MMAPAPAGPLRFRVVVAQTAADLALLVQRAIDTEAAAFPNGMLVGAELGGGGAGAWMVCTLVGTIDGSAGVLGPLWSAARARAVEAVDSATLAAELSRVRAEQAPTSEGFLWAADTVAPGAAPKGVALQIWGPRPSSEVGDVQTAFFVDSVDGADDADALTPATAIRSVAELSRRLYRRTIDAPTTVTLAGNFVGEVLELDIEANALLTFQAATTVVHAGTIASVTQTDPATLTRGTIEDLAGPFTGLDGARLRLTSGAMAGALAYVTRVISATEVNVSRWALSDPATTVLPTIGEPVPGDEYVIETLPTRLGRQQILNRGSGRVLVRDVAIESGDAHQVNNFAPAHQDIVYYGVSWGAPVAAFYRSDCVWLSCAAPTVVALAFTGHIAPRACLFSGARVQVSIQSSADFQRANCFKRCQLLVLGGSHVNVTGTAGTDGDMQFCDFVGGDLVVVGPGSVLEAANAGALMWGADNATVNTSFRVFSGGGLYYVTTPTIPGAPAGQDCRVGGTFLNYAGLPFVEPANGAAMVVRV